MAISDKVGYVYIQRDGSITHKPLKEMDFRTLDAFKEQVQYIQGKYPELRQAVISKFADLLFKYIERLTWDGQEDYSYYKVLQSELKQMKIGLKISDNDLNIKIRKIKGFLEDGDKVKIMIIFRGREMAHKEIGNELLNRVLKELEEVAIVEGKPQFAGRNLSVGIRKK
ncbi:translation initiation factor IF-3 [Candidatus Saccharibacteria bacterium]|nr:translation initiation factor IF-3 [Candidatus Saccharibacteria bacterium]